MARISDVFNLGTNNSPVLPDGVLGVSEFDRLLHDLAIWGEIEKARYFQLIKLYNSDNTENMLMASKVVMEKHNAMDKE